MLPLPSGTFFGVDTDALFNVVNVTYLITQEEVGKEDERNLMDLKGVKSNLVVC